MRTLEKNIPEKIIKRTYKNLLAAFFILLFFLNINSSYATVCSVTKVNGGGFTTTISSVTESGGVYTVVLTVEHDGCSGPTCKSLSHYSVEALAGTYSNISVNVVSGSMTYSTINYGPNLGGDPFNGFRLDNTSNIGDGVAGIFTITYDITSLQDQQTSAKANQNSQIAAFTQADFQYVLNCTTNNPPVAVDDNATTPMNTPVDITEMANDIVGDAALDPTSITFVTGTAPNPTTEGTFTVNATTGLVTFTPVNGFVGTVTIDYNVCDLNSLCDDATILVVITPITGPIAVDDNATTPFNTPVDIIELANDILGDAALDPTSVSFVGGTEPDPATEGLFTVNATTGLVTFTPVSGFSGTVTIDYEVCDLNLLCDIATITVIISSGTDTDGDGVPDVNDDYPNDPDRAFNNYYPAAGNGTLAYEDLWPGQGDYDFNDLVIDYRFMTVTSASNHIVETFGTFIVKAFGASLENGFGFQLANSNIADADIISVTGYDLQEGYINLEANGIEEGQSIPTIIVYDNAFNILTHPGSGIGVNTTPGAPYVEPDTLNMFMSYTQGTYTLAELDIPNFNPFLIVDLNRGIEIHLPDYLPTDKADQSFFGTINDDSNPGTGKYYKTVNNLPWAIHITEPFEYPTEKSDITSVYLKFTEWAESGGQLYQDWYRDEPGYRNSSLIYTHN